MKWAQSLIRISNHQVEALQKRLAEVAGRRAAAEMRLTMLHAEAEAERTGSAGDADAGWDHVLVLARRYRPPRLLH